MRAGKLRIEHLPVGADAGIAEEAFFGVSFGHTLRQGLSRDWGSGCGGDFGERVVRGEEALPEAGAERAVVDGAADLEQPIGTAPRPAHLPRFVYPALDEEVGRSLGQRRANPQPGPVPLAVV